MPTGVCLFDTGITLYFQPAAYWAGEYIKANEGCPIDRWMLMQHPLVFICWVGIWITFFSIALLCLPTRASLVLAFTLVLGNATGASSWLTWRIQGGVWLSMVFFLVVAILMVATLTRAGVFKAFRM